jgi:hypothetical protein
MKTSATRLAKLREVAQRRTDEKALQFVDALPVTWKEVRPRQYGLNIGPDRSSPDWRSIKECKYLHVKCDAKGYFESTLRLRRLGWCDEVDRCIEHRGWYTTSGDNWSGEVMRGVVYQLPARNGQELFLAGYVDGVGDTYAVIDVDPTDDKIEASRWADDMARVAGEACVEDDERFQAQQDKEREKDEAEERMDELRSELADVLRLIRLLRNQAGAGAERARAKLLADEARLRGFIEAVQEEIGGLHDAIEELAA